MSKSKNKAEKLHLFRVAGLGCIVCKNLGHEDTPAEIHHIRTGCGTGQRADNFCVIPLCHIHHRTGGHGVAVHAGRQTWENNFGTETELLVQVMYELEGGFYA
ncbi:Ref family recombination enhancement nuclease [Enterobacter sp.]|uniref:Ref family recombination enhancement nuclease n=1 Tax=Enterobacter sp. TaxID=42895 RepID=UPI003D0EF2BF